MAHDQFFPHEPYPTTSHDVFANARGNQGDTWYDVIDQHEQDAAWDILNAFVQYTAWDILNESERDTAWDILNAFVLSVAWDILNGYFKYTSWNIFAKYLYYLQSFIAKAIVSEYNIPMSLEFSKSFAETLGINFYLNETDVSTNKIIDYVKTSFEIPQNLESTFSTIKTIIKSRSVFEVEKGTIEN